MQTLIPVGDFGPFCINGRSPIPWDVCAGPVGWKVFIGQGGFPENIPGGISTKINLQAARDNGIPAIMTFYWLDPEEAAQITIDRICRDLDANNPDGWAGDDEQPADSNNVTFDPGRASDYVRQVFTGVEARRPDKKNTYYSRPGFIKQFRSPLIPFLSRFEYPWMAANPGWGLPRYYLSAADIAAGKCQIANYNTSPFTYKWGNLFDDGMGPDVSLFPNAKGWIWQTGGNRMLEGWPWEVDWDYANFDIVGWLTGAKPEPPPTLTLESLDARLRVIEALPWYRQMIPVVKTGNIP